MIIADFVKERELTAHNTIAHLNGQFKTRSEMLKLGSNSFRTCLPSSAWKDSKVDKRALFSIHDSEPYMSAGRMQHSLMLNDKRGFSSHGKHPCNWPCEKNAVRAL